MEKIKIKFTADRGGFKADQIVEVEKSLGLQLLNTGKEGSAVEAPADAKVTSRNVILAQQKATAKAKAKALKDKIKAKEEE